MSDTIIPFTFIAPPYYPFSHEDWCIKKAHADDAAYDLRAAEDCSLAPGDRTLVKTGVRLAIPEGFAGLVLPRSGLALKHGITVLNPPGLIDPGYRGEVGVILVNHEVRVVPNPYDNDRPMFNQQGHFHIERGDRIAQLLIIRTADVNFAYEHAEAWSFRCLAEQGSNLNTRDEGGFGSTGR